MRRPSSRPGASRRRRAIPATAVAPLNALALALGAYEDGRPIERGSVPRRRCARARAYPRLAEVRECASAFPCRSSAWRELRAWCEGRGRRQQLDMHARRRCSRVGTLGARVSRFRAAACMTADEAAKTNDALDALEAALAGETISMPISPTWRSASVRRQTPGESNSMSAASPYGRSLGACIRCSRSSSPAWLCGNHRRQHRCVRRKRRGHVLLVFTEDPLRVRETLDIAVIVPELVHAFPGRFRVGVLLPARPRDLSRRATGSGAGPHSSCCATAAYVGRRRGSAQLGRISAGSSAICSTRRRRDLRRSASRSRPQGADAPVAAPERTLAQGTLMKTLSIPVRVVGPGSQPEEEPLQYLDMPRDDEYIPDAAACRERVDARGAVRVARRAAGVRRRTRTLGSARWAGRGPRIDVERALAGSARHHEPDARRGRSRHPGSMARARCTSRKACSPASGGCASSMARAGSSATGSRRRRCRTIVISERRVARRLRRRRSVAMPEGAMNSPALLSEIARPHLATASRAHAAHVDQPDALPAHAGGSAACSSWRLPVGPVAMISRGFGNCQITSTLARNVWRVQYFNTHEYADPQHARDRRCAGGRACRGGGSGRQPRASRPSWSNGWASRARLEPDGEGDT